MVPSPDFEPTSLIATGRSSGPGEQVFLFVHPQHDRDVWEGEERRNDGEAGREQDGPEGFLAPRGPCPRVSGCCSILEELGCERGENASEEPERRRECPEVEEANDGQGREDSGFTTAYSGSSSSE